MSFDKTFLKMNFSVFYDENLATVTQTEGSSVLSPYLEAFLN